MKIVNSVAESMVTSRRHGAQIHMRTAADSAGTLLARDVVISFDTGAYADNGPRVTATGGDAAPGPYRWSAVRVDALCVYTNTAPSGSYRAFGASHVQWVGEMQVDEVARRAGIDALEIRRRNLLRPGEQVRPGGKPLDADLIGDIEKVAEALGWHDAKPADTGRGLSVGLLAAGAHPVSSAVVRLEADGEAIVLVGSTEMGQGQRTAFAQIAAEVLGLEAERVRCIGTDTRFTPYDRSTGASRSTTLAGLAVQRAAQQVRADLLDIAALIWPGRESDIELADGCGLVRRRASGPSRSSSRSASGCPAASSSARAASTRRAPARTPRGRSSGRSASAPRRCTIDRETGAVTVTRTATVADVGKAINPQLVERQDEGATMQGIGNAMFEEMVFSDGVLLNDDLLEYRIPSTEDLPARSTCVIVENGDGPGPFGAKGCGEGAFAGIIGALATAVADAGVPMHELPLTPERVWRRIDELTRNRTRRHHDDHVQDGRGDGHRHDGPRHGRGPGAGRLPGRAVRHEHRGARTRQGGLRAGLGRARPARDARRRGWLRALRERRRGRPRGRRVRHRGHPREPRAQAAGLRRVRAARRTGGDHRLQHVGHPGDQDRGQPGAPGAGRSSCTGPTRRISSR